MKQVVTFFGIIFLLTSCSLFENKEKKAIELVQKTKVQFGNDTNLLSLIFLGLSGLDNNATWLDFANSIAKQDQNKFFSWSAIKTDVEGVYQVSFLDETGWGHWWEVSLEDQIVKHINSNAYLTRKYKHSQLDKDNNFEITDIKTDILKIEKNNGYYSNKTNKKIVYIMNASVINNTGKTLTSAKISGKLQVIFKDKTIEESDTWSSGFKKSVSKYNPWETDTKRDFSIKTNGIEELYLEYSPEYVFFNLNIDAEDPVGYKYDKAIEEYDLKEQWLLLK